LEPNHQVWHHEDSDKLFCEEVDVGEDAPRLILSGLRQHYTKEQMMGRKLLAFCNLKARNIGGIKSHGMVLCASSEDGSKVEFVDPPADAKVLTARHT
jgi:methionine--tRNA ligase beta chain